MFVEEPFWYFDGVLSQRFLDELIRHGTEQKEILALTGKYKGRKGEELSKKESNDLKSKMFDFRSKMSSSRSSSKGRSEAFEFFT